MKNCTGINCIMQFDKVDPATCKCVSYCPQATPPLTNSDCIRAMSDEELSLLISETCPPGSGCLTCKDYTDVISGNRRCDICWLDWLKKETE